MLSLFDSSDAITEACELGIGHKRRKIKKIIAVNKEKTRILWIAQVYANRPSQDVLVFDNRHKVPLAGR